MKKHLRCESTIFGLLGLFVFVALVLLAGGKERWGVGSSTSTGHRTPAGGPRLVSVQPFPEMEMEGEMCQWMPANANQELLAMLQRPATSPAAAASADGPRVTIERAPLRVIKDPFPTYSAVAVDMTNNEIVLQDENLFQVMAYDRMTNTPPSAAMSEPKRVIGGHHTKMEFNCGLYIDPKNGDLYSVNNDTIDTLTVFSREARGDVPPTRELSTPHRTYGIAVDEGKEELFLTVQDAPMVVVYKKYASGKDQPIRVLRGNKTQLADAHGIAIDTKNGWMFVVNYGNGALYSAGGTQRGPRGEANIDSFGGRVPGSGYFTAPSITVYPLNAEGDVAPIRVIKGPKTQFNWPAHIYIDEASGDLYVANDGGHSILVFKVTDGGDVVPTRVIKGPRTGIKNPTGVFLDTKNKELVVANMGNHMATVYPLNANGDVAPKRVIRAAPADQPALQIGNPGAVAYDSKRDEILVPN